MTIFENKKALSIIFLIFTLVLIHNFYYEKIEDTQSNSLEVVSLKYENEEVQLIIPSGWVDTTSFILSNVYIKTYIYGNQCKIRVIYNDSVELSLGRRKENDMYFRIGKLNTFYVAYEGVEEERYLLFEESFDEMGVN